MSPGTRTAGAIVAALATLVLGAASRAPWTASPADHALLRLSWRVQSESAEECRPLSEEEKADLPVHMRVPEVCETRAIPYLLQVTIDGSGAVSDTVHGAGARGPPDHDLSRDPLAAEPTPWGSRSRRSPGLGSDAGVALEYSATIRAGGAEVGARHGRSAGALSSG
jgi:hypothetical protein